MGERLLKANGLYNDNDFRCDSSEDMQDRYQLEPYQPQRSTLQHTFDVLGKWFGQKILRNNGDTEIAPKTRNELPTKPSTERRKMDMAEYTSAINGTTQIALLLNNQEQEVQRIRLTKEQGSDKTPSYHREYIDPPPLINEDDVEGESISPLKVTTHISTQIETGLKTKDGEGALRPPIRTSLDSTRWDKSSCNLNPVGRQDVYNENNYTYAERVEAAEARILSALDIQEVESRLNLDGQWHWLDSSYNEEDEDEETITSASDSSMEKFIKDMNEHTERRILNPKQVILEFESMEASRRKEEELCLPSNYKYRRIETFFAKRNNMKEKKAPTNNVVQLATRLNRKSRNETIVTTKRRRKIIRTHMHKHRWAAKRSKNVCSMKTRKIFKDSIGYRQQSARLVCNRSYVVQKIGIALEMIALLRRCLYPKRDVIRWNL